MNGVELLKLKLENDKKDLWHREQKIKLAREEADVTDRMLQADRDAIVILERAIAAEEKPPEPAKAKTRGEEIVEKFTCTPEWGMAALVSAIDNALADEREECSREATSLAAHFLYTNKHTILPDVAKGYGMACQDIADSIGGRTHDPR